MSGFQSGQTLDPIRWLGGPFALCIAGTILLSIPLRVWGLRLPEPVFAFVPAFAWAVIRPSVLAPVLLLILGLFMDYFWGGSRGLWAIALILSYGFVLATRSSMTGQGRLVMWAWYAVTCAIGFIVAYLLVMLDVLSTPSLLATFLQWLVTAALYPAAHYLIQQFEDADIRFR